MKVTQEANRHQTSDREYQGEWRTFSSTYIYRDTVGIEDCVEAPPPQKAWECGLACSRISGIETQPTDLHTDPHLASIPRKPTPYATACESGHRSISIHRRVWDFQVPACGSLMMMRTRTWYHDSRPTAKKWWCLMLWVSGSRLAEEQASNPGNPLFSYCTRKLISHANNWNT